MHHVPFRRVLRKRFSTSTHYKDEKKNKDGKGYQQVSYNLPTPSGDKKDISGPLPGVYSPKYVEAAWYDWWEKSDFFRPEASYKEDFLSKAVSGDIPFVMVLPPPNVTGTLHLGHALTNSIQDALVRWNRMHGRKTLWVPGCDHAGIATQVVVEKKLWQEQKKTRHQLGREEFVNEVWKWKNEKCDIIYDQMKKMGSSLDWTRSSFTMNEKLTKAVVEAFVKLHEDGLIYRSNRLVNWSCALKSAISDIEVDSVVVEGKTLLAVPGYDRKIPFGVMTSFAYPVEGSDQEIVVSTTRLETMLGDVAVAVHPEDPRFKHLHGKHVVHPFDGRRLPIICDDFVEMELGTGAVKITPAHDYTDCEVGQRHNLSSITVMDDEGKMVNVPSHFNGHKRFQIRKTLAGALKEKNLYRGEVNHVTSVPICSRSGDVVEPRLKEQWFVRCEEMAVQASKAVEEGQLRLIPASHEKVWLDWLNGIRDWCISRQLWWGHRIPAYRVISEGNGNSSWVSGRSEVEARKKASGQFGIPEHEVLLQQDEDVLDTWFSSALFPFSVFGWPDSSPDLNEFYPISLLETGSDIIFFWVARMVMMGLKLTGQLPFPEVLFHGILRDSQGRKMSKSLGNVIDPMDVIHGITLQNLHTRLESSNLNPSEISRAADGQKNQFPQGIPECGADSLRFTLCSYDFKAGEINMDITHTKSNRHFCNKIWQAFRFVQDHLGNSFQPQEVFELQGSESAIDRWILSRLSHMVKSCDTHFRNYDLHYATKMLYLFWFTELCDVYLECVKPVLQVGTNEEKACIQQILYTCVETFLRALSPFMPFLSEELFQRLPPRGSDWPVSVCVAPYPKPNMYGWLDPIINKEISLVQQVCSTSLSIRKDFNLTKIKAKTFLSVPDSEAEKIFSKYIMCFKTLARAETFEIITDSDPDIPDGCVTMQVDSGYWLHVLLKNVVEPEIEMNRLSKRKTKVKAELKRMAKQAKGDNSDDINSAKLAAKIDTLDKEVMKIEGLISAMENLVKG